MAGSRKEPTQPHSTLARSDEGMSPSERKRLLQEYLPDAAINRGGKLVLVAQSQHIINAYRDRHYDDAEADMI
jgi:hypothetical protein